MTTTTTTTIARLAAIVTVRDSWSLSPDGTLTGMTGTVRSISAKTGITGYHLEGGDWAYFPSPDESAIKASGRARAILAWLVRPVRDRVVLVTLEWPGERLPEESCFGRECLAALGCPKAAKVAGMRQDWQNGESWGQYQERYQKALAAYLVSSGIGDEDFSEYEDMEVLPSRMAM